VARFASCLAGIHELRPDGIPTDVDIWLLRFRDGHLDEFMARLSEDERRRCLRYRRQAERIRYAGTRAFLKERLAEHLRIANEDIELTIDACGKPRLVLDGAPHFNLSYAGDCALIALSDRHPVGVDIEAVNATLDTAAVAAALTPDELQCCCGGSDTQNFFRIWSGKEAVLKALGVGIAEHLRAASLTVLDSGRYALAMHMPAPRIAAWPLPAPPGHVAALAIQIDPSGRGKDWGDSLHSISGRTVSAEALLTPKQKRHNKKPPTGGG
jgi:4'-phosphopantetheinyl transferase